MEFGSKGLLNKIPSSRTTEYPGEIVFKTTDMLKTQYAPKEQMTIVERIQKLNSITLAE